MVPYQGLLRPDKVLFIESNINFDLKNFNKKIYWKSFNPNKTVEIIDEIINLEKKYNDMTIKERDDFELNFYPYSIGEDLFLNDNT